MLSKKWFLCNFEFVLKSHASVFSTNFYCLLQQNFLHKIKACISKKMPKQITSRISASTGWLREKCMVRKPRVKERKSLFFTVLHSLLHMLFPRKARVFTCTNFPAYIHINISRNIFQVLIMHALSNSIEIHGMFFYLIFYGNTWPNVPSHSLYRKII